MEKKRFPKSRVCLFVLVPTARIATLPYTYSIHSQTLLCGSGRPKQVMDNIAVVALNFCRPPPIGVDAMKGQILKYQAKNGI